MISTFIVALGSFASSHVSLLMMLAKATIILIAALGITVSMQRASAGARHLVWLVTLGMLLLVQGRLPLIVAHSAHLARHWWLDARVRNTHLAYGVAHLLLRPHRGTIPLAVRDEPNCCTRSYEQARSSPRSPSRNGSQSHGSPKLGALRSTQ